MRTSRRSRNMSQATARDARMCQGTFFFTAVKHMFGFEYFVEADGYAIIEALSEFLTGFSYVRSESFLC